MELRPILSTLRRHKTTSALIIVEIAISAAIICNALFLISERIQSIQTESGLTESEIVKIRVRATNDSNDSASVTREDMAALRALPGVKAASSTNQVTYGGTSWNSGVKLRPEQKSILNATSYMGDQQLLNSLGLRLIAGRPFEADEFVDWADLNKPVAAAKVSSTIITQAMAQTLFQGENAVGKTLYASREDPMRVVGIVERLVRPGDQDGSIANGYSMILPINVPYDLGGGGYVLRVEDPLRRQEIIDAAIRTLEHNGPTRIIDREEAKTLEQMRDEYYHDDREMAWMLTGISLALLIVTALGIVGLASFWVQQRTRQIGVRRALGATKTQILRYFQVENFVLATLGIVVGMLLAYAINQLLMSEYELPRLPLYYLPIGAVTLWLLGQIAVLGPARRASAVPPAVASRTV